MTNLQGSAPNPLIPRLLLWVPAGVGGVLALLVLGLGTFPLISQLQIQGRQQQEKLAMEQRLPQMRSDLARLAQDQVLAEQQQQQLLTLIAGSGDLITFMAQADRAARRQGIELQLYEPTVAAVVSDAEADPLKGQARGTRKKRDQEAAANDEAAAAANKDPLRKAGLSSTQLLLSAKGRYPNLLAFVRTLEALGLLVVQSNLSLSQGPAEDTAAAAAPSQQPQPVPPVVLKLAIALYSPIKRN